MTPDIAIFLCTLLVMAVLFVGNFLAIDLVAFVGLMILTLLGFVPMDKAFAGFSSSAVITMLAMFIIGSGLRRTGVAESVARRIYSLTGSAETANVLAVMLLGASLSAFMNNVAATAVLLPAVVGIANQADISPSRLLIPLSFSAILGGMTTAIGTTPNIIINDVINAAHIAPFGILDFSVPGIAMTIAGVLFFVLGGLRLLPQRNVSRRRRKKRGELQTLYKLKERLFSVKIPSGSSLAGSTLGSTQFGKALSVVVTAVQREGKRILAPRADFELKGGDVLVLGGKVDDLVRLLKFQGVSVEPFRSIESSQISEEVRGAEFRVDQGEYAGESLRNLHFRERYNVVVVGVQRGDATIYKALGELNLQEGDILHVLGKREVLSQMAEDVSLTANVMDIEPQSLLHDYLFSVSVGNSSQLVGLTIQQSEIGALLGLTVGGILRGEEALLAPGGRELIKEGDRLLISGDAEKVQRLAQLGELQLLEEGTSSVLESQDVGVVEAVLSPRSRAIGKTLIELDFREKYGFQVLAVWRNGRPKRTNIANFPLQFGDALLLQGPRRRMQLLAEDPDFVVLTEDTGPPKRGKKAPAAVLSLLLVIGLSVFKVLPIHIASFVAALCSVLGGAVSLDESYRDIEWRVVFLIAALIPLGGALQSTGAAELIATDLIGVLGSGSPLVLLAVFALLASAMSQLLDGSIAVVLLAPIVLTTTAAMGIRPEAFLMTITLAASIAFLTPFSHKANLLVMSPGGYRVRDYFVTGVFLTVICLAICLSIIPIIYPF